VRTTASIGSIHYPAAMSHLGGLGLFDSTTTAATATATAATLLETAGRGRAHGGERARDNNRTR
jgi:hypothetical protein